MAKRSLMASQTRTGPVLKGCISLGPALLGSILDFFSQADVMELVSEDPGVGARVEISVRIPGGPLLIICGPIGEEIGKRPHADMNQGWAT